LRLSLLPRERRYFDYFQKAASNVSTAALALTELLARPTDGADIQHRIKELEHRGDEITHEVVRSLNRTFVTPFDREDIHALAKDLDDVLDYIEEISETVTLYNIQSIPRPALELAGLLVQASNHIELAITQLEVQKDIDKHWIEVHRLENIGDEVMRRAIGDLFRSGTEPIEVMKLKDFYELLESAIDSCEDVANVIENIVIKNG
jgi:predicted phosphate transport protein (TIGR00153 family)